MVTETTAREIAAARSRQISATAPGRAVNEWGVLVGSWKLAISIAMLNKVGALNAIRGHKGGGFLQHNDNNISL